MQTILVFVVALAFGFDRGVAAFLMGAEGGQTISQVAGLAARARTWWGVAISGALDVLVEPNHCELALSPEAGATSTGARIRSAVLLVLLFLLLTFMAYTGWSASIHLIRTM